ncbi:MAG: Maf family protein [Actinomycetes bacterium]
MTAGVRRPRLVLASASPARLATLRAAGIDPEVLVSGVAEDDMTGTPVQVVTELARRKAVAAAAGLAAGPALVLGADSLLELDGQAWGKPADPDEAAVRWQAMRGRAGVLHTGHALVEVDTRGHVGSPLVRVASATVHFAPISDAEIAAYVATGEPLTVAGAFTIDGLGGAFIDRIEGDPHTVVGLSLPLLRRMLAEIGVSWTALWTSSEPG